MKRTCHTYRIRNGSAIHTGASDHSMLPATILSTVIRSRHLPCLLLLIASCFLFSNLSIHAQSKKISPDLFGLFFEDINYSADGGLYAEQIQNRSFEYSPTEKREWHPLSYWEYISPGFSYGRISVETAAPLNDNNPHYVVIDVEHVGNEPKHTGDAGVGLKNSGFGGIVVRKGQQYDLSVYIRQLSSSPIRFKLSLQKPNTELLAQSSISTSSKEWKKYTASFTATADHDTASLVILAESTGKFAIDVVSLFPKNTFKNRPNGLRADLATKLAEMEPKFVRFPGGCLAHGDGLGNMYRWKNTIGPVENRKAQRNIWGYHQTAGLGYFEYFQFCEDIGAKPLPVLPAGVSCQNSGGTWRIGGTGQKAIPMEEMSEYVQEVLDLVEWANGPVTSEWGAKRAEAGHPAPFNLEYVGIGNEDKITPEFEERFKMIYAAVRAKYPSIKLIGTSGPFHSGEDFTKGWKLADELNVPIIDEHYYTDPNWFMSNHYRYDGYDRKGSEVYLGEYASWGNKLRNAIAEAAYMTGLERNGDIVRLSSYAPLLAKDKFTQWKTDMIFFDNVNICLTPNYYVQKLFSVNHGDRYHAKVISKDDRDTTLAASCVQDSKTGDIILKMVNFSTSSKPMNINLGSLGKVSPEATQTILTGNPDAENTLEKPDVIIPTVKDFTASKRFVYETAPMSLTVIRIKTK